MHRMLVSYPVRISTLSGAYTPDPLMNLPADWMLPLLEEQHPEVYRQAKEILDVTFPYYSVLRDLLISKECPADIAEDLAGKETRDLHGYYSQPLTHRLMFEASIGLEPEADFYPYNPCHGENFFQLQVRGFANRCRPQFEFDSPCCVLESDKQILLKLLQKQKYQEGVEKGKRRGKRREAVEIIAEFRNDYLTKKK